MAGSIYSAKRKMNAENSYFTLIATQAALQAGELLKKGFSTSFQISSKEGKQNLVTEYDKKSEDIILSFIQKHFPSHDILSEERGAINQEGGEIVWIVDPLDGTVNFAHNIPMFSISIAACRKEEILCGVIFQPMTQELFVAEKNRGAFLNGTPIQVSKETRLDQSLLATGFPYNVDENPNHCIDTFSHFIKQGLPIRRLGSAAIDMAYVAAGRFAAYWEVLLHPWDVAAGKLIVEEAGGLISCYDGSQRSVLSYTNLLATNGIFHDFMIKQLTQWSV
jgi:myo-inositol-1(or 4)-monophosphatase